MFKTLQQLLIVLVLLLQIWATLQNPVTQNYTNEVLRIAKAAHIKAYINEEVPPCRNFYKYACGKWKRLHPASESAGKTTVLQELKELYIRKSAEMLKDTSSRVDTSTEIKLKDFYRSCRNEVKLDKLDLQAILKVMNFKGGWPAIESTSWYESGYDWLKTVADLRRNLGVNILIGMEVIPDMEDINTHRIMVGAPKLNLVTKDAYLKPEYEGTRQTYKHDIEAKLRRFFRDMPENWSSEVAQQVLEVERQLANGLSDDKQLTLKQISRLRSAADLKAAYGNYVDLSRYLNLIFNQTIYVQVYESPIDYMSTLVDVIKLTPKLSIANYTMWRVLEHLDFAGEVNKPHNDIWCLKKTMEYFERPLESLYHRNFNNMPLINELQSVWSDIKKTFREQLQSSVKLNWLTQETRQKAILKLDAMELEFLAHDNENFAEQMQNLSFKNNSYYGNLIQALQWHTQHNLAKLIEQPMPEEAELKLPRYEPTKNKILIPITFLQSRFFWDTSYPHALKYSTLGFLLAEEMVRGFDATGRRYDNHGYQRAWWDSVSEYAYTERARCFDKQYANYNFHGKSMIGMATQSVTVPDNGGISIAYKTYQKWWKYVADNELSALENLPLLDLTQNQLFFVGFAQLLCADYHETAMENLTTVPERLRVIGSLANMVEFAKEFKCDMGLKMNPENKCVIY